MKKCMFSVAVATTACVLCAQEMGMPETPAPAETTQAPVEAATSLEAAAASVEDGGSAIIALAEEHAAEISAKVPDEATSALDQVNSDLLDMGLSEGYDPAKRAIIQVKTGEMIIADPAHDPAFMVKREQISTYALLNARAEIIRAIFSDFTAMDRAMTMLDETLDDNMEKVAAAKEAVETKRAELAEALAQYSATDAKTVAEVTLNDRFTSFLDAVIKKIDSSYDPAAIASSKKIDAEAAKVEAAALKEKAMQLAAEYKTLVEAAAALPKDPTIETASTATLLSKMPLLGSSVITQAESWDPETKNYTIAVAVVWSPKLQENARKMATGDFSALGKPGKLSRAEWVKAQDWSCMVGARRFTDEKGNNLFVGISAVDAGVGARANAKKMIAETMARKNVAMSLIGDLETFREASQNLKVYADDSAATSQKLADTIGAKLNLTLSGCMALAKKEVKHPVTGKKIYVAAFYIDPAAAKDAGDAYKKAYADAGLTARHTAKRRGQAAGISVAYEKVKNDTSAYEAGRAEGAKAVTDAIVQKEAEAKAKADAAAKAQAEAKKAAEARKATEAKVAAEKAVAEKAALERKAALEAQKKNRKSQGGVYMNKQKVIDTDF